MQIRQIEDVLAADPQALFASCSGDMVRPVRPVNNRYCRVSVAYGATFIDKKAPKAKDMPPLMPDIANVDVVIGASPEPDGVWYMYDKKTRVRTEGWTIYKPSDPWAKCGTASRPLDQGALCDVWNFDRDGNQTEYIGRMLIRTKDIGGTWGEYLTLHAVQVRKRADDVTADREARELGVQLRAQVAALDLRWPVGEVRSKYADSSRETEVDSLLSSDVEARARNLRADRRWANDRVVVTSGGEVQPYPSIQPAVSIHAGNPQDVTYLLTVLERGVRLTDNKLAEFNEAIGAAWAAADGDSNDAEIDALRDAVETAALLLGVPLPTAQS